MQRHTHDLVQGLVNSGHHVEVICPAHETLDHDAYGAVWHLVDTPGRSDTQWLHKFRETFLAAERESHFDVVHSETNGAQGLLLKPRVATPIVVKYHGNYFSLLKAHARRIAQRPRTAPGELKGFVAMTRTHLANGNAWAFRSCVSMAPSFEQTRDTALSHFVPRELMHAVPNGIDATLFRPRDKADLRHRLGLPDGPHLVAAGRLSGEKGFDVAIEALARAGGRSPEARLLILGDGAEQDALRALAERRGVLDRVSFLGPQSPEVVAEYMSASDVFVFPTRRHEAGPIVLLEGMASALPTIATRIGGNTEVVESRGAEPAGILIGLDDADALASAIGSLLDEPARAEELGRRARERILEEYTVERMVERTVDVYRRAIDRARLLRAK